MKLNDDGAVGALVQVTFGSENHAGGIESLKTSGVPSVYWSSTLRT